MTIDPIYFGVSWNNGHGRHRARGHWNSWNSYYPRTIIDDVLWQNGHPNVLRDPSFFGYDTPFFNNNSRYSWQNNYHRNWAVNNWSGNQNWYTGSSSDLFFRFGINGRGRHHRHHNQTFAWNNHGRHHGRHHSNNWGWNPWICY